ncbi:UNVERIFIED_CONTAM: hypothetical protein HHA_452460 [Hammondia hammondi]|eukprot:XP_008885550.1 hypothetical protein HHA_452460 [Hammondia hammondi]
MLSRHRRLELTKRAAAERGKTVKWMSWKFEDGDGWSTVAECTGAGEKEAPTERQTREKGERERRRQNWTRSKRGETHERAAGQREKKKTRWTCTEQRQEEEERDSEAEENAVTERKKEKLRLCGRRHGKETKLDKQRESESPPHRQPSRTTREGEAQRTDKDGRVREEEEEGREKEKSKKRKRGGRRRKKVDGGEDNTGEEKRRALLEEDRDFRNKDVSSSLFPRDGEEDERSSSVNGSDEVFLWRRRSRKQLVQFLSSFSRIQQKGIHQECDASQRTLTTVGGRSCEVAERACGEKKGAGCEELRRQKRRPKRLCLVAACRLAKLACLEKSPFACRRVQSSFLCSTHFFPAFGVHPPGAPVCAAARFCVERLCDFFAFLC